MALVATESKKSTVQIPSKAVEAMGERWDLIHDLLGGTKQMREAGTKWLPKEPKEQDDAYKVRLDRSFLYEGFKDTTRKIVSKPFARPIILRGEIPEKLKVIEKDADNTGTNLSSFGASLFNDGVTHGISFFIVDYPNTGGGLSLYQERAKKVRPYFVQIHAGNYLGCRFILDDNNRPIPTQLRWSECVTVPDGEYSEKEIIRIRVMTPTTWEIHEKEEGKDTYVKVLDGKHTFGRIPLVVFYTGKTGYMTAIPPLEGLAWLNLEHWQSSSDQRNILRFARFAILFQSGVTHEEMEKGVTVGPTHMVRTTNPNGRLEFVEHSGAAIGAGQADIDAIEQRMETLGMQPFTQRSGDSTATGKVLDEAKSQGNIYDWVRNLEEALTEGYKLAAEWEKVTLPEDFKLDVHNDFGLSERATTDVDQLIKIRAAGELSRETFLTEIRRRGTVDEMLDITKEMAAVEAEGKALAEMTNKINQDAGGTPPGASSETQTGQ